jgi:serine/threonine-protein kinase ATR
MQHESAGEWSTAHLGHDAVLQALASTGERHHAMTRAASDVIMEGFLGDDGSSVGAASEPLWLRHELGLMKSMFALGSHHTLLQYSRGTIRQLETAESMGAAGLSRPARFGIQAAWRIGSWDSLRELLGEFDEAERRKPLSEVVEDLVTDPHHFAAFETTLGRLLLDFRDCQTAEQQTSLSTRIRDAMGDVVSGMAVNKVDSIEQAGTAMARLHMLTDIGLAVRGNAMREQIVSRERLTSLSLRDREPLLSVLTVLSVSKGNHLAGARSLLTLANAARREGHRSAAFEALMRAQEHVHLASGDKTELQTQIIMTHAKLELADGKGHSAVALLNAVKESGLSDATATKVKLQLARVIMHSQLEPPEKLTHRYHTLVAAQPESERLHFDMACYLDNLLSARCSMLQARAQTESQQRTAEVMQTDLLGIEVIQAYGNAVRCGSRRLFHALPRLLTLWFALGEAIQNQHALSSEATGSWAGGAVQNTPVKGRGEGQARALGHRNTLERVEYQKVEQLLLGSISAWQWYTVLPQLLGQICHKNTSIRNTVIQLCSRVGKEHPEQTLWHILPHRLQGEPTRREKAEQITSKIRQHLANDDRRRLPTEIKELASKFQAFAKVKPPESAKRGANNRFNLKAIGPAAESLRDICRRVAPRQNVAGIILPLQRFLHAHIPSEDSSMDVHSPFADDIPCITDMNSTVHVMTSQAKPKKFTIVCSDNREYSWLAKGVDDLRKDSRLMQLANLVNTLLRRHSESRNKGLTMRTYSTIPLDERSGLIEWVEGCLTLRSCIDSQWPNLTEHFSKLFKQRWEAAVQEEGSGGLKKETPEELFMAFQKRVPPVFARWQESQFGLDPSLWYKARLGYSRSAAVTSMVGFVIGLGDRHGENILINADTGRVTHIDFDCMFWKASRTFHIPERVPFRLTQNVRDGFGVTGYEGTYRRSCEITLGLLRDHWESVRPVLESLIYDPIFEHLARDRKGLAGNRRQRGTEAAGKQGITEEPAKVLSKIRSIVRGESARNLDILAYWEVKAPLVPSFDTWRKDRGAQDHRLLTLSVEGQVQEQIEEATNIENLSRMYVGWNSIL